MKNLSLIVIALVLGSVSMAQEQPQRGFNYQAVARDMDGNVLKQQPLSVRVQIYQNEDIIWQEEHNETTNNLGMFNIIVGNPEAGGSGSAGAFSEIDWASGIFNIKVDVNTNANDFQHDPPEKMINQPQADRVNIVQKKAEPTQAQTDMEEFLKDLAIKAAQLKILKMREKERESNF